MSEAELKSEKKKLKKEKKHKDKEKDKEKKLKKEKKTKKRKDRDDGISEQQPSVKRTKGRDGAVTNESNLKSKFPFPIQYILAPMVGASELPFRLLCRKYGAQTAYTPMMCSTTFASDAQYRLEEFQTIPEDRPLVVHFSANDPLEFTNAAKLVQDKCDAIDLNLGCPQRTAYLGHFGSYLLDPVDRTLICDIVKMASQNVSVPIFCKIRLLDSIEDTILLCRQLKEAGAALIAIHGRYRASFERKGAGARDGAAMLDQILKVREALPDFPIIANGNVITYDDVESNMRFTKADGIMSAEGILDNPALFLPRYGEDDGREVTIAIPSALSSGKVEVNHKEKRKLAKKLREIQAIESKAVSSDRSMTKEQKEKLANKESIIKSISELEDSEDKNTPEVTAAGPKTKTVLLKELNKAAQNKTILANEYLSLAEKFPTKLRTIIFHTRRILKEELNKYQLMEECIGSKSIADIRKTVSKISKYQKNPSLFQFDTEKAQNEKDAMERKQREEGKRKEFEARMLRKAKREGKLDLEFYLRQGSKVPAVEELQSLKKMPRDEQMSLWKANEHSQHCMSFHLDEGGCKRDRKCAFLHADAMGANTFTEMDEVAG